VVRRDPVRQAVFDATRPLGEQLGREVSLCLRYHAVTFRGKQPQKLWLLGEEAADPQMSAYLTAALPIAVEAARPLERVDTTVMTSIGANNSMSQWALALGLALKTSTAMLANALADPIVPNAPRAAAA
jgi:type IV pilus assembly protein PilM